MAVNLVLKADLSLWLSHSITANRRIDEEGTKPLSENPSWKNSLDIVDEGIVVQKIMQIIKSI